MKFGKPLLRALLCYGLAGNLVDNAVIVQGRLTGFHEPELTAAFEASPPPLRSAIEEVALLQSQMEPLWTEFSQSMAKRFEDPKSYMESIEGEFQLKESVAEDAFREVFQRSPSETERALLKEAFPTEASIREDYFSESALSLRLSIIKKQIPISKSEARVLHLFHQRRQTARKDGVLLGISEQNMAEWQREALARGKFKQITPTLARKEYFLDYASYVTNFFLLNRGKAVRQALVELDNPAVALKDRITDFANYFGGTHPQNIALMTKVLERVLNVQPMVPSAHDVSLHLKYFFGQKTAQLLSQARELLPAPEAPAEAPKVVENIGASAKGPHSNRPFRQKYDLLEETPQRSTAEVIPEFEKIPSGELQSGISQFSASDHHARRILKEIDHYDSAVNGELLVNLYRTLWILNSPNREPVMSEVVPVKLFDHLFKSQPLGPSHTVRAYIGKGISGKYYLLEVDPDVKHGNGHRQNEIISRLARQWRSLRALR